MPGGFPLGELCDCLDYGTDLVDSLGGININCGNGVKSSWVSLGTLTRDICALQVQINARGGNTSNGVAVDIGFGAGGSQLILINDLIHYGNESNITDEFTPILPFVLPSGTPLWTRGQGVGTSVACNVEVHTWQGSFDQVEGFAGVDGLGVNYTTAISGVNLQSNVSTAYTKGAYSVMVSSTPRDYAGFFFNMVPDTTSTQINHSYVDIAVGATGSEVIIVPNWHVQTINLSNGACRNCMPFFHPIPIPAGTKVSARFQTETANKLSSLAFYGVYR
jgi:hypothetical protein